VRALEPTAPGEAKRADYVDHRDPIEVRFQAGTKRSPRKELRRFSQPLKQAGGKFSRSAGICARAGAFLTRSNEERANRIGGFNSEGVSTSKTSHRQGEKALDLV